jgi:hypothetical protein
MKIEINMKLDEHQKEILKHALEGETRRAHKRIDLLLGRVRKLEALNEGD